MKKREFIKTLGLAGLSLPLFTGAAGNLKTNFPMPTEDLPEDAFWNHIRMQYQLKPDYINLENGYYNIVPHPTLNAQIENMRMLNHEGTYYMRTRLQDDRIQSRKAIAEFLKCPFEEIIITRNTTESMDTVISGFDWKQGDEAIMAEQEYGSMLDMFKQQAKRYGMKNILINIPQHPNSDEEIVALYEKAITPRTKLILVSHIVYISGHILPIKKICAMAHTKGVKVLVDGAHALGHFEFSISDLNCDYYGSSLHKWLSVPLGAGILYVKKSNIASLWPLFGENAYPEDDIRKLNHTGTGPFYTELSISAAIQFYHSIGGKRKEDRLRYLKNYWCNALQSIKGIQIQTPKESTRCCGIATIGIDKMSPEEFAKTLFDKYHIWTVAINNAGIHGCRITPNVYTTTEELDQFIKAVKEIMETK